MSVQIPSKPGVTSVATVGSSPNSAGAVVSGQVLTLEPADATNPGLITSGAQNIGGAKSFSSAITSTVTTGTAPLVVASTTRVANLNVASAGNADTVTTNANLTGVITSSGNATSIASQTGTGTKFVVDTGPTMSAATLTGTTIASTITSPAATQFHLGSVGNIYQIIDTDGNIALGPSLTVSDGTIPFQVYGASANNSAASRVQKLFDTTSATTGTGGGISFGGWINGTTSAINDFGNIKGIKENATPGNSSSAMVFSTRVDGGSPTEQLRINSSGQLLSVPTYNNTTASAANMFIDSTGLVWRSTSSIKYKQDIQDDVDSSILMDLKPITYVGKEDTSKRHYGFIAEEIEKIDPRLVHHTQTGEPDGVQYERLTVLLIKALQELKQEFQEYKDSHK